MNEGWIKIQSMEKEHFTLDDGTKVPLYPFHITEKGLSLTPAELAKLLFNLSPDDIYVRTESGEWIVRDGNFYISSHRSFFPKREYGYYENELLDSISGAEINVPLSERVVGFESEEAVENYFKTRAYQGSSDNADKPRV